MRRMDESLSQEIKRRIECTTSLETMCSEQISAMEVRLNSIIDERVNTVKERLDLLENNIKELNTLLIYSLYMPLVLVSSRVRSTVSSNFSIPQPMT